MSTLAYFMIEQAQRGFDFLFVSHDAQRHSCIGLKIWWSPSPSGSFATTDLALCRVDKIRHGSNSSSGEEWLNRDIYFCNVLFYVF